MKPLVMVSLILSSLIFCSSTLFAQTSVLDSTSPARFACQFHATQNFSRTSGIVKAPSSAQYLDLMARAQELERELVQLDISSGQWTEERIKVLISLAQVKQSVGDTAQSRELFEDALYTMRITDGVHTLDQLPVIFGLMASYMGIDDEFADQLGDRAAFLYEKNYTEDSQIPDLITGYRRLLELRRNSQNSNAGKYSIHSVKAEQLGVKISRQIENYYALTDPATPNGLVGEAAFFTSYDDLGQVQESPDAGVDQVTAPTGKILYEVQNLLRMAETEEVANYEQAKLLLDELHERYDELPYVDRTALLDFYADYYLAQDNIPETISYYEKILAIRVLRPDYQLRALRSLGQLYENEKRWNESIDSYNCWRQLSAFEDLRVFIGLTNAYHRLDENELAIHHMLKYLEMLDREGEIAEQNMYVVLRQMYYDIGDFTAAAEVSRTMLALYK